MGDRAIAYGSPLLLVHGVGDPTVQLLRERAADVYLCGYVLGGPAAVPDEIVAELNKIAPAR